MKSIIERLEASIPETEKDLVQAKHFSDTAGILRLSRRLRNQRTLLALLKAYQAKRLDDAELEMSVTLPELS